MTVGRWYPVLSGAIAETATNIVLDIASKARSAKTSACSAAQLSEQALLFGYFALVDASAPWLDIAIEHLNFAASQVSAHAPIYQFGGICGFGWAYAHTTNIITTIAQCDIEDPLIEVDQLVREKMEQITDNGSYDLIGGLVGVGVYFLERFPAASATDGLSRILECLAFRAERSTAGIAWHTPPELLPAYQRSLCPSGHYNLGMAHGHPAVIRFLLELIETGIQVPLASQLLDEAILWIINQRQPSGRGALYGYWVAEGSRPIPPRLGWCYGDLGVAIAIYQTGERLGRTAWVEFAEEILIRTTLQSTGHVRAETLCHGALGVAHMYRRLLHSSESIEYRMAALHYYERALAIIAERNQDRAAREHEHENGAEATSMLESDVGIALALLAATTPIEPQWDRRLMLSGWRRNSSRALRLRTAFDLMTDNR